MYACTIIMVYCFSLVKSQPHIFITVYCNRQKIRYCKLSLFYFYN